MTAPEFAAVLRTAVILVVAFALDTAIGFKRQWRQRTAGTVNLRSCERNELLAAWLAAAVRGA